MPSGKAFYGLLFEQGCTGNTQVSLEVWNTSLCGTVIPTQALSFAACSDFQCKPDWVSVIDFCLSPARSTGSPGNLQHLNFLNQS